MIAVAGILMIVVGVLLLLGLTFATTVWVLFSGGSVNEPTLGEVIVIDGVVGFFAVGTILGGASLV